MEGSYFYLIAWCSWIVATFWMKKNRTRLLTALSILLVIAGSKTSFVIGDLEISCSIIVITLICFLGISQYSRWQKVYAVFSTAIIAMLYAVFHIIELYDPVWIIMNRVWLLSIIVAYVSLLLTRQHMLRIFVMCIGGVQGEALIAISLKQYGFHNDIGEAAFFDVVACAAVILCTIQLIVKGLFYIQPFRQRYVREGQG